MRQWDITAEYTMKKIISAVIVILFAQCQLLTAQTDVSLCRVSKIIGLYTFTDCEPASNYEVIGEVTVSGETSEEIRNSGAQYQSVRDELIKTAKAANGQVEGIILTLVTGGIDKAYLIKFNNTDEDFSLARAKRYSGLYVFCDSEPLKQYEYLGNIKGKHTWVPQYTNLRDDFIKKCAKQYKDANAIILHLVTGGKDSAEAIKL